MTVMKHDTAPLRLRLGGPRPDPTFQAYRLKFFECILPFNHAISSLPISIMLPLGVLEVQSARTLARAIFKE